MTRWTPLALLAALAPLTLHAASGPDGRWTTPWGEMQLHLNAAQVDGSYNFHGGRISGRMNGNVLTGYWIQDSSEERCSRTVAGSAYWGRVSLTFDGDRFTGNWSYCNRTPDHSGWDGTRIAAGSDAEAAEKDPTALVLGALAKALPPKAANQLNDLLGDDTAATKGTTATAAAAGAGAAPPPAVTLEMAMGELYPEWRTSILNGHPKTITGDLTCDGSNDYFVGWADLDNPDRPAYHIAVVYHDGDRLAHQHTTLELGGDSQYSLCVPGPNVYPEVTLSGHGYSAAERSAHGLPESCAGAVRLDDGMCDALYIGWEPVTKQFLLDRN